MQKLGTPVVLGNAVALLCSAEARSTSESVYLVAVVKGWRGVWKLRRK